jgi:hypothetical protein
VGTSSFGAASGADVCESAFDSSVLVLVVFSVSVCVDSEAEDELLDDDPFEPPPAMAEMIISTTTTMRMTLTLLFFFPSAMATPAHE